MVMIYDNFQKILDAYLLLVMPFDAVNVMLGLKVTVLLVLVCISTWLYAMP